MGDKSRRVIGIDLGGTNIKAAAVNEHGQVIAKAEWPTEAERGVDHVIRRLEEISFLVTQHAGWKWSEVTGMGIGVPGFLDFQRGMVEHAVNIGWRNIPITSILSEHMGIPVLIDNDANCAAMGEAWVGSGQGYQDLAVVTIGTGIGGGIILNGRIHRGENGMAGEIGHLVMERNNGHLCNCGKRGCLETISSATAILRDAKEAFLNNDETPKLNHMTTQYVIDLARSGDPVAFALLKQAMETLGLALSYIGNTLNLQRIVIGGGVSKAGEIVIEMIVNGFQQGALPRVIEACQIVPAMLGNDAGVIGAAKLAIEVDHIRQIK